jgi:hypothetical protein
LTNALETLLRQNFDALYVNADSIVPPHGGLFCGDLPKIQKDRFVISGAASRGALLHRDAWQRIPGELPIKDVATLLLIVATPGISRARACGTPQRVSDGRSIDAHADGYSVQLRRKRIRRRLYADASGLSIDLEEPQTRDTASTGFASMLALRAHVLSMALDLTSVRRRLARSAGVDRPRGAVWVKIVTVVERRLAWGENLN